MSHKGLVQSLALVNSQLEAASTLLKFATDDLRDLSDRSTTLPSGTLPILIKNLTEIAVSVDANAAFCMRLAQEDELEMAQTIAVG